MCPPAIVTMQHQGWWRQVTLVWHTTQCSKALSRDFQQQQGAAQVPSLVVSFSSTLTRSLGAARALLHQAARFLLSRIAKSDRGRAADFRTSAQPFHCSDLWGSADPRTLSACSLATRAQCDLNDWVIVKEKVADGNIAPNIRATYRTKRIYPILHLWRHLKALNQIWHWFCVIGSQCSSLVVKIIPSHFHQG